jgi:hypothetical protein
MLFSAAQAHISRISSESRVSELVMYRVIKAGSMIRAQIQVGYPGMNASGNATIWAPWEAAWAMREQVFATVAFRSNQIGSAWTAAALTVLEVEGEWAVGDIVDLILDMERWMVG